MQQDQAARLREKINSTEVTFTEEVDIFALPPRSEKHGKSSEKHTLTDQPGRIHFWITRIIVITFIAVICFIIYYFSMEMVDHKIKDEADQLVDIIK